MTPLHDLNTTNTINVNKKQGINYHYMGSERIGKEVRGDVTSGFLSLTVSVWLPLVDK